MITDSYFPGALNAKVGIYDYLEVPLLHLYLEVVR